MQKLTREYARAQVQRLLANPMIAPQSDEGAREIIDCLMRHCETAEHAQATMTIFLDQTPEPRNVTAELASAAQRALNGPILPPGCEACAYKDPLTGVTLYYSHLAIDGAGKYSAVVRCTCARGKLLQAADRQRDEAQKAKLAAQGSVGGVA